MTARTLIGFSGGGAGDYPFLNFLKATAGPQSAAGYNYPPLLDTNGYPTSSPTFNVFGVLELPSSYVGRWVLKWPGPGSLQVARGVTVHDGASFVVGGTASNLTVTGTDVRVEFTFLTPPSTATINFLGGATFSSMSGAVLCRLADEVAIDAAVEIFLPDFIARLRELNPRVVRPMGWTDPNDGNNITKHSYRNSLTHFSWS